MSLDPYLVHWVPQQDQPWYAPGTDVFRLYSPTWQQIIAWLPGEHVPCWLDFLPNRDARATYQLCRGDPPRMGVPADLARMVSVPPGPLRQCIAKAMEGLSA